MEEKDKQYNVKENKDEITKNKTNISNLPFDSIKQIKNKKQNKEQEKRIDSKFSYRNLFIFTNNFIDIIKINKKNIYKEKCNQIFLLIYLINIFLNHKDFIYIIDQDINYIRNNKFFQNDYIKTELEKVINENNLKNELKKCFICNKYNKEKLNKYNFQIFKQNLKLVRYYYKEEIIIAIYKINKENNIIRILGDDFIKENNNN